MGNEFFLPDYLTESIGKGIRRVRKSQSYSIEDLADRLNMTVDEAGRLERGETQLTINKIDEIAGMLDTTTEELMRQEEGFYIGGDITSESSAIGNGSSCIVGVSEETLNKLTAALNRMCDMLDKKL